MLPGKVQARSIDFRRNLTRRQCQPHVSSGPLCQVNQFALLVAVQLGRDLDPAPAVHTPKQGRLLTILFNPVARHAARDRVDVGRATDPPFDQPTRRRQPSVPASDHRLLDQFVRKQRQRRLACCGQPFLAGHHGPGRAIGQEAARVVAQLTRLLTPYEHVGKLGLGLPRLIRARLQEADLLAGRHRVPIQAIGHRRLARRTFGIPRPLGERFTHMLGNRRHPCHQGFFVQAGVHADLPQLGRQDRLIDRAELEYSVAQLIAVDANHAPAVRHHQVRHNVVAVQMRVASNLPAALHGKQFRVDHARHWVRSHDGQGRPGGIMVAVDPGYVAALLPFRVTCAEPNLGDLPLHVGQRLIAGATMGGGNRLPFRLGRKRPRNANRLRCRERQVDVADRHTVLAQRNPVLVLLGGIRRGPLLPGPVLAVRPPTLQQAAELRAAQWLVGCHPKRRRELWVHVASRHRNRPHASGKRLILPPVLGIVCRKLRLGGRHRRFHQVGRHRDSRRLRPGSACAKRQHRLAGHCRAQRMYAVLHRNLHLVGQHAELLAHRAYLGQLVGQQALKPGQQLNQFITAFLRRSLQQPTQDVRVRVQPWRYGPQARQHDAQHPAVGILRRRERPRFA